MPLHPHPTDPGRVLVARPALRRAVLAAIGVALAALVGAQALAARAWIGTPFPGFFVLPNRVIPSVGLPSWTPAGIPVYQRTVGEVDALPVTHSAEVYERARWRAPATPTRYTLHGATGTETVTIPSVLFSERDYWAIFGGYLVNGALYLLLALLGSALLPGSARGRALLMVGATGGLYAMSAAALYTPTGPLRLHALMEAVFPATLIQLALVLPDQRPTLAAPLATLGITLSLALAVPFVLLVEHAGAYSALHTASETAMGVAGIVLLGTLLAERGRAGAHASPLVRGATTGALLGIGVPAVVLAISGVSGGQLPVNVMTIAAPLFPSCLAYGLLVECGIVRELA